MKSEQHATTPERKKKKNMAKNFPYNIRCRLVFIYIRYWLNVFLPLRAKSSVWVNSKNTTESFLPVISISAYKCYRENNCLFQIGAKRSLFNWTFTHVIHTKLKYKYWTNKQKSNSIKSDIFSVSSKFSTAQN